MTNSKLLLKVHHKHLEDDGKSFPETIGLGPEKASQLSPPRTKYPGQT